MGLRSVVKKGVSLGFQPKRWLGLEHVKSNGKVCKDLLTGFFDKEKSEQALRQEQEDRKLEQQMTASDLESRKKLALGLMSFYGLVSLGLFIYTGYLWFAKALILPGCMPVIIGLLVVVYALREFIVFGQIHFKRKRLGLSELCRLLFGASSMKS